MFKNIEKVRAGMTFPEVLKIMGKPYRVIKDESDDILLILFQKKRFFKRKQYLKITFKENLVYKVKVSTEKELYII